MSLYLEAVRPIFITAHLDKRMKRYTITVDGHRPSFTIDYQNDLNPEQYKVVTEADGPSLVLAGPGSGKTRTLIYRLAFILENGVPAQNILLMTFTNKAAHQMQYRLELLLKAKPVGLWCGTFHHIGNRSLRMYAPRLGIRDDFGILDEEDQKDLIKICAKALKARTEASKLFPSPTVIQAIISYARNSKQPIEKIIEERYPYHAQFCDDIKKIHTFYERKKRESNNLDYDDLLTEWIRLLETAPSARERFTKQFRYILVDEYQDTNRLQFDIITLLSSHHKNILAVGDDAQSIYSFRAADIRNILDFPRHFEGTKIFKLQTNYRSVSPILNLANSIIQKNQQQFQKVLVAARGDSSGERPNRIALKDLYAQSAFVAQRVLELREEGIPLDDIAVLYRAHYQSAELELELIKRSIPYIIRGGVRFFEQTHIKDVLSFVRIMQNPSDELAWVRALMLHPGIGSRYAQTIFEKFSTGRHSITDITGPSFGKFLPERARRGFDEFKKTVKELSALELSSSPDVMIQAVLKNGYENYALSNFENGRDRIDDIKELANFAHTYKGTKDFLADVTLREGFRGETILGADDADDEHLILSTIHQAKGLEWKEVFMIGLCDGQFPHPKSFDDPAQLEEERRLFYVGVTRAKDRLYLVHPMTRYDYTYGTVISRPSMFLQELPDTGYEQWEIEQADEPRDDG